jgi:hypothetical protein
MGKVAIWLAMTVLAAGCGSDGDAGDEAGSPSGTAATTTVPVPSSAAGTTVPPRDLTLRITNVRLAISEEADRGMRVLLPAGVTTASVTLTGVPSPNRVISVCQIQDLDGQAGGSACRTPAGGEAVTVTLGSEAKGVEVVHAAMSTTGSSASSFPMEGLTIRYSASSREVNVRLPEMEPGDSGPTAFALTPVSADGAYRATLTWRVIAAFGGTPSNGQIEVLDGGRAVNQRQGTGEVQLSGNVPTPVTDAAIRVQNLGTSLLVTPKLSVLLP